MKQATYTLELQSLVDSLPAPLRKPFLQAYAARIKDPSIAVALNTFVGTFGGDRIYSGRMGSAVLKFLTAGGLGIWVLVDLFIIGGVVRKQNIKIARELITTMRASMPDAASSSDPA